MKPSYTDNHKAATFRYALDTPAAPLRLLVPMRSDKCANRSLLAEPLRQLRRNAAHQIDVMPCHS